MGFIIDLYSYCCLVCQYISPACFLFCLVLLTHQVNAIQIHLFIRFCGRILKTKILLLRMMKMMIMMKIINLIRKKNLRRVLQQIIGREKQKKIKNKIKLCYIHSLFVFSVNLTLAKNTDIYFLNLIYLKAMQFMFY